MSRLGWGPEVAHVRKSGLRGIVFIAVLIILLLSAVPVRAGGGFEEKNYTTTFTGREIEIFNVGVGGIEVNITEQTVVQVKYSIEYPQYIKRNKEVPVRIQIDGIHIKWNLRINGNPQPVVDAVLDVGGREEFQIFKGKILGIGAEIRAVIADPQPMFLIRTPDGYSKEVTLDKNATALYLPPTAEDLQLTILPNFRVREGFKLTLYYILGSKSFEYKFHTAEYRGETPIEIEIPLAPLLRITSTPSGADAYIDDANVGKTPVEVEVAPGTHRIRVTRKNYIPQEETLSVTKDTQLHFDLKPSWGLLTVDSSPSGAEVIVDGNVVGTTPLKELNLSVGTHRLVLRKEGYGESRVEITIRPGELTTLKRALEPTQTFPGDQKNEKSSSKKREICGPGAMAILALLGGFSLKKNR